jgi:archaellum component FlaG (FlaF/FlaG flagellin family)
MLVSFSNEPTQVILDGQDYGFALMKGNDCYTIQLPPGKHGAEVITGNSFSYGVNVTSLWSTTVIAIFGFLAVVLLAGMYLAMKFLHRRTNA